MIIRLRALAKDAALAAFASAKPGRSASADAVELELLHAENDRLSEALNEVAVELTLHKWISGTFHDEEQRGHERQVYHGRLNAMRFPNQYGGS